MVEYVRVNVTVFFQYFHGYIILFGSFSGVEILDFCKKFLSTFRFKRYLLLVVYIRFLTLTILRCLVKFSMHAKTGLSWVVLECISLYIKIFNNITKEIWKLPGTSTSLERISSFSTSVNISFDSILFESWDEIFFFFFYRPL